MTDDIVTRLKEAATSQLGEYQLTMAPELCLAIANEIERWRDLAIHAWVHMGIDATCSDDDCEQCQAIKKAWENK